jgi:hypothetical protein
LRLSTRQRDTYADTDTDGNKYCDKYPDGYVNADEYSYCHEHPDSYTNANQRPSTP